MDLRPLFRLKLPSALIRLSTDRRGVSAMEYAVLAVGILTLFAVGISSLSASIQNYYGYLRDTFVNTMGQF